jgi:hypothetical protein
LSFLPPLSPMVDSLRVWRSSFGAIPQSAIVAAPFYDVQPTFVLSSRRTWFRSPPPPSVLWDRGRSVGDGQPTC